MGALTRRALLLLLLLPGLVVGQQQASEYELKAAFLYNFATYVDWPEESFSSPDAAFVFGVVGSVELAANLELIAQGRDIRERRVEVRRLDHDADPHELQVLFVGAGQEGRARLLLEQALPQRVLTVTEARMPPADSIINFAIVDGKVRFDVRLPVAQRAGLSISSRLLGVARQVIGQRP